MLFQSNGTFTPDDSVKGILFILRGGGGGAALGGAGGGACVIANIAHVNGQTYNVNVGRGGVGNSSGDHGGSSTLDCSHYGNIGTAVGGGAGTVDGSYAVNKGSVISCSAHASCTGVSKYSGGNGGNWTSYTYGGGGGGGGSGAGDGPNGSTPAAGGNGGYGGTEYSLYTDPPAVGGWGGGGGGGHPRNANQGAGGGDGFVQITYTY